MYHHLGLLHDPDQLSVEVLFLYHRAVRNYVFEIQLIKQADPLELLDHQSQVLGGEAALLNNVEGAIEAPVFYVGLPVDLLEQVVAVQQAQHTVLRDVLQGVVVLQLHCPQLASLRQVDQAYRRLRMLALVDDTREHRLAGGAAVLRFLDGSPHSQPAIQLILQTVQEGRLIFGGSSPFLVPEHIEWRTLNKQLRPLKLFANQVGC